MESAYFKANGHLGAILPLASGNGQFRVRGACQGGYCFEVTVSRRGYVTRIAPKRPTTILQIDCSRCTVTKPTSSTPNTGGLLPMRRAKYIPKIRLSGPRGETGSGPP